MVVADGDPRVVGVDVVDPVGDRFGYLGVGEVVHLDLVGLAGGLVFAAAVGLVAHELLLLRVDADHRVTRRQVLAGEGVDVAELAVPGRDAGGPRPVWKVLAGCSPCTATDRPPWTWRSCGPAARALRTDCVATWSSTATAASDHPATRARPANPRWAAPRDRPPVSRAGPPRDGAHDPGGCHRWRPRAIRY